MEICGEGVVKWGRMWVYVWRFGDEWILEMV